MALFVALAMLLPVTAMGATGGVSARYANGAVKIGSNANTCNSTLGGAIRYVSATGTVDFCNGTNWLPSLVASLSSGVSCVAANKGALKFDTAGSTSATFYSSYIEVCDGSAWVPINPPIGAAGAGTYVQFNSGGSLSATSNMSWNYTDGTLNISGIYKIGGQQALQLTTGGNPVIGNTNMSLSAAPRSLGIGRDALAAANTEMYDLAVGHQTLQFATAASASDAAIGVRALYNETSGNGNIAAGYNALYNNTTGTENTAVGSNAMYGVNGTPLTGGSDTAVGSSALSKISGWDTGALAIGRRAYYQIDTSYSGAVGTNAFASATTGNGYVFGWNALGNTANASGGAFGANAGSNILSSNNNVMIGYNTTSPSPGTDAILNIGNTIYANIGFNGVAIGAGDFPLGVDFGLIAAPPATQTIAATNTITADSCGTLKSITAGSAVSTNTTNTFTAPATANKGCCMDVLNVGTTNTITLKHNALFFTSGGADLALAAYSMVRVCSTGSAWYQIGPVSTNN